MDNCWAVGGRARRSRSLILRNGDQPDVFRKVNRNQCGIGPVSRPHGLEFLLGPPRLATPLNRVRRSTRGQSWAEKSLKNGRILVEFQRLRKPQDAKGTYFPRNSPSALLEWGSGGRWFESSRPDIRRPVAATSCGWPFFSSGDPFRPPGRVEGRDSTPRTIRYSSRPA